MSDAFFVRESYPAFPESIICLMKVNVTPAEILGESEKKHLFQHIPSNSVHLPTSVSRCCRRTSTQQPFPTPEAKAGRPPAAKPALPKTNRGCGSVAPGAGSPVSRGARPRSSPHHHPPGAGGSPGGRRGWAAAPSSGGDGASGPGVRPARQPAARLLPQSPRHA